MTDGVVSLRPDVEIGEFFDYLYETQVGYVYAPLKDPKSEEFEDSHFYEWPRQRSELISHVLDNTLKKECYFGPALYKDNTNARLDNIMGSNVVWAEFDGNAPTAALGDKIPHPSMRIQSSNDGHEHLYWKLDGFETDRLAIETINRSIAYTLSADTSGWDATQILRPPSTKNHKRDRIVRTITTTSFSYSRDFFGGIPVPKQLVKQEIDESDVPDALDVVSRYKWESDAFAFFRKTEMPQGTRSSALMRLAYTCTEMRMSDEEAFSILFNADERWGKFKGRRDQAKRLLDLVNRARIKYPIDPEVEIDDDFQVFSWTEILELEIHIEWMIPGLLQRQGLALLSGPPSVGKTQLALQFLKNMALGHDMFDWKMDVPRKTVFFSMEMGVAELKYIMEQMDAAVDPEDRPMLHKNFRCVPIGYGVLMDTEADQLKIRKFIEAERPEVIVFDSLSVTTNDELSDERTAKKVMDFANHLRIEYDMSVIFIHHNRKAQSTNKKPKTLADVYGSQFLTSQPTTVILMWRDERTDDIEILFPKVRLAKQPPTKIVRRHHGLTFKEVEPSKLIAEASALLKEPDGANQQKPPPGKANLSL